MYDKNEKIISVAIYRAYFLRLKFIYLGIRNPGSKHRLLVIFRLMGFWIPSRFISSVEAKIVCYLWCVGDLWLQLDAYDCIW